VSALTVLLLAGPTRLPLQALSGLQADDADSDSDTGPQGLAGYSKLGLDEWIQFVGPPSHIQVGGRLLPLSHFRFISASGAVTPKARQLRKLAAHVHVLFCIAVLN
jgi:hypothetical protein